MPYSPVRCERTLAYPAQSMYRVYHGSARHRHDLIEVIQLAGAPHKSA